jgi:hypothetical protein
MRSTGAPYEEIYLNLFSQGIESPGVVPVERWAERIEQYATGKGKVVGVDAGTYPMDAGGTLRFTKAFKKAIRERFPLPEPVRISDVDRFLREAGRDYPVEWL